MNLFKKKPQEKESNIATTPIIEEQKSPYDFDLKNFYLLLWNIASIAFYCCYVFYLIMTVAQQNFLSKIIVVMLYGYGFMLLVIILSSFVNKNKLKSRLKNFKSAVKFLQYFIQTISFVLSIVTALSVFFATGKADLISIKTAISSLVLTVIMVLLEIFKIWFRSNVSTVKKNFLKIQEIKNTQRAEKQKVLEENRKLKEEQRMLKQNRKFGGLFSKKINAPNNVNPKSEDNSTQKYSYNSDNYSNLDERYDSDVSDDNVEDDYYPELSENDIYDEESGVIISYDDDEYYSQKEKINKRSSLLDIFKKIGKKD